LDALATFLASGQTAYVYWTALGMNALNPLLNHSDLALLPCVLFLLISAKCSVALGIDHYV
jgi:hypothetical protein